MSNFIEENKIDDRLLICDVLINRENDKFSSMALVDTMKNQSIEVCIEKVKNFISDFEKKFNCKCRLGGYVIKHIKLEDNEYRLN